MFEESRGQPLADQEKVIKFMARLEANPKKAHTEPFLNIPQYLRRRFNRFGRAHSLRGICNICGHQTSFYYYDKALYRESLFCGKCRATSRYRSVARGILQAVQELTGLSADSLAVLPQLESPGRLKIYDTQAPFYLRNCAYPVPDVLSRCKWIELFLSVYNPGKPWGIRLGKRRTNQNLENLTFPENHFDIVITSDVMEHVRLDEKAHREIRRVLKPGGFYIFSVPHFRDREGSLVRIAVQDPLDPSKDQFLLEPEFHGAPSSRKEKVLCYRSYGKDLDNFLGGLGFNVEYSKEDLPEMGIMNTELFYCRLSK